MSRLEGTRAGLETLGFNEPAFDRTLWDSQRGEGRRGGDLTGLAVGGVRTGVDGVEESEDPASDSHFLISRPPNDALKLPDLHQRPAIRVRGTLSKSEKSGTN